MAKSNQRGRNNNNPSGRNQYSNDFLSSAKDHPIATAAAAAAAVGAGMFLWAKRDKVGNQVSRISQTANEMAQKASTKASDWMDSRQSEGPQHDVAMSGDPTLSGRSRSTSRKSRTNASSGKAGAETVTY